VLNRGNLEIVDQVVDPAAVVISPHLPEPARGRQGFKDVVGGAGIEALAMQYPLPEEMIAEGDSVAVRFIGHGTHRGEFAGAAPTGKPVTFDGVFQDQVLRVERPAELRELVQVERLRRGRTPAPDRLCGRGRGRASRPWLVPPTSTSRAPDR
jgi:hypothetical protein